MERKKKQSIFRQKSLDRVSSPEELNSYIKVCTPPMWIVLIACIVILFGAIIWAVAGELIAQIKVVSVVSDKECLCYVPFDKLADIKVGNQVTINGSHYVIKEVSKEPIQVTSDVTDYVLEMGDLKEGQYVYEVLADVQISDGVYEAYIVNEKVRPSSFLLGSDSEASK